MSHLNGIDLDESEKDDLRKEYKQSKMKMIQCNDCEGEGYDWLADSWCVPCNGTGEVPDNG